MGLKREQQKFTRRQHPLILSTDEMKSTDTYTIQQCTWHEVCNLQQHCTFLYRWA
jgi:hypothetical protein